MPTVRPGRESLGARLALMLECYGLKSRAVARLCGVSATVVSAWANGHADMPQEYAPVLDALSKRCRAQARKGGAK